MPRKLSRPGLPNVRAGWPDNELSAHNRMRKSPESPVRKVTVEREEDPLVTKKKIYWYSIF